MDCRYLSVCLISRHVNYIIVACRITASNTFIILRYTIAICVIRNLSCVSPYIMALKQSAEGGARRVPSPGAGRPRRCKRAMSRSRVRTPPPTPHHN